MKNLQTLKTMNAQYVVNYDLLRNDSTDDSMILGCTNSIILCQLF